MDPVVNKSKTEKSQSLPVLPKTSANAVETIQQKQLSDFSSAIKDLLPKSGNSISSENVHKIIQAACKHLGGVDVKLGELVSIPKINSLLNKNGFEFSMSLFSRDKDVKVSEISVSQFDLSAEKTFNGKRFEKLIGLTKYPDIKFYEAQRTYFFGEKEKEAEGGVNPGLTIVKEGKEALVLTFPADIKKQLNVYKDLGIKISAENLKDMVEINEAAHSLLDNMLGGRKFEIAGLRIPIKEPIAVRVPAFDHRQFHEVWSDAATFKLTKDFPNAISLLGRQNDEGHLVTFQLLHSTTVAALHLWTNEAKTSEERIERASFSSAIVRQKGPGQVSISFDILAARMKTDPELQNKMQEVVGGVYQTVANGVIRHVLEQKDSEK